ncbi:type II toxin-antitoxin system RelB/DinJ family antitoxin [Lapidilactobacillus wuchangensis]|uniref:type II toxin-antitoxin system RelB/DinJ family antitoxin n=1 Tax=Lapidilactobacillus wuchangensis TaxID=2486001 RepID=UPI000F77C971|nr:type II toxin-antitoxin system RelB/DinJ family antitoxin [Lapidilactobacillus wuchangensis]
MAKKLTEKHNARIEVRIDNNIKLKALAQLKDTGLTLSDYLRASVSTLANEGLPKGFGAPNAEVLASLTEAIDDLEQQRQLPTAHNRQELEQLLNDD